MYLDVEITRLRVLIFYIKKDTLCCGFPDENFQIENIKFSMQCLCNSITLHARLNLQYGIIRLPSLESDITGNSANTSLA